MARILFDNAILSVLTSAGAVGVGWKLHFYTGGSAAPIATYNARTAGSANANPLVADAEGRFGVVWVDDSQTIKWVLADENDVAQVTVDDVLITSAASVTISAGLVNFLAGSAPLAIANGGTGAASAASALAALGALPVAGGTVTGNIIRSGKGAHPYFNAAAMTGAKFFMQAVGADPTSNPGDTVYEY